MSDTLTSEQKEAIKAKNEEIIGKLNPILTSYTINEVVNVLFEITHGIVGQVKDKSDLETVVTKMHEALRDGAELALVRMVSSGIDIKEPDEEKKVIH